MVDLSSIITPPHTLQQSPLSPTHFPSAQSLPFPLPKKKKKREENPQNTKNPSKEIKLSQLL